MSTSLWGRRGKRRRGSILLLAIFFLIILFSLATAFFRIIPAEFHSASQAKRAIQAQYTADAGIREAVAWLKLQPGVDTAKMAQFSADHADSKSVEQKVDDDWSYTVSMQISDPTRKIYSIVSTAYFRNRPVSETRTTVRNETFAKYALFYDTWGDDFLFTMAPNAIQGPFHTNDYFHLAAPDSGFWTDGKEPFVNGALAEMTFGEEMSASMNTLGVGVGDGNMYYGGNFAGTNTGLTPFDDKGKPNADRYNKMISGGREKLSQIEKVKFPEALSELRYESWGDEVPTDMAALKASKGPLLVNTDAGPNTPNGKLKGGILYASDAKSVRLEITTGNGNHQKTKITDSTDTVIPGGGSTSYSWKEQKYSAMVPQPDKKVTTGGQCTKGHYEDAYRTVSVPYEDTETGPHPSCGTETVFIPGAGGVSTPIKVNKSCTRKVTKYRNEEQKYQKYVCDQYAPTVVTYVPQPPKKQENVAANYPGAFKDGEVGKSGSTPPAQGTYLGTVTETKNNLTISTVNSVIEVNDATYKIPWFKGIKVNGVEIPETQKDTIIVPDGKTITIKNDITVNGKNYAEYTIMDGRVNGVVFSDGHMLDVQGTSKGSKYKDKEGNLAYRGRTLATDIVGNKNLEISGNLLQYYGGNAKDAKGNPLKNSANQLVPGNQSPNAEHILGIVAQNITIKQPTNKKSVAFQNTRSSDGKITNYNGGLTVYAVLMAGRTIDSNTVEGGFGVDDSAMQSDDDLGDFNLFGGIVSGVARSTQNGKGDGSSDGFRLNLNYDEIAAHNLERFPTTNLYNVVRYVTIPLGNLEDGFGSMSGG